MEPALVIEDLSHAFGDQIVLENINLRLEADEILCLVGASGSGKSTLLRIIAGLIPLQAGKVCLNGLAPATPGREPTAQDRACGFVFQDHALFPHLSVAENVGFGIHKLSKQERHEIVKQQLLAVNLSEFQNRFPHTLSGGEQQRVAIARALAVNPSLLLMDEPFLSVDVVLRRQLREDTRNTLRQSKKPSIIVTHDPAEALDLGDRIAVLHAGRIVQDDVPAQVWSHPENLQVARMFCDNDELHGTFTDGAIHTPFGALRINEQGLREGQACSVVVRPSAVSLRVAESSSIELVDTRFLGDRYLALVRVQNKTLRVESRTPIDIEIGSPVELDFDTSGVFAFAVDDNDSH